MTMTESKFVSIADCFEKVTHGPNKLGNEKDGYEAKTGASTISAPAMFIDATLIRPQVCPLPQGGGRSTASLSDQAGAAWTGSPGCGAIQAGPQGFREAGRPGSRR